jgi:ribonuclease J
LIKPEYVVPIHGEPIQRNANKHVVMEMGIPTEKIFLIDNGAVIELYDD